MGDLRHAHDGTSQVDVLMDVRTDEVSRGGSMAVQPRPRRAAGLDVNELDDGLIVFREAADTVHHLNHTAAFVLELCDGSRTSTDIAALLGEAYGLPELPVAQAEECIRSLSDQGLIS
jgi:hypothetical protein